MTISMKRYLGVFAAAAFLATVAPSTALATEQGAPAAFAVRSAPKANPLNPKQQLGRRPAFAVRSAPKANPLNPKQQLGRRPAFAVRSAPKANPLNPKQQLGRRPAF